MKETTNYKLKMPEVSDPLSITPLNENAQMIDAVLYALGGSALRMVSGKYTGSGSMSAVIETPGIRPVALFMRLAETAVGKSGHYKKSDVVIAKQTVDPGFAMWCGNDLEAVYWERDGEMYDSASGATVPAYRAQNTQIMFTSQMGRLFWKMNATPTADIDHSFLVNNKRDVGYEWLVLGVEEVN